MTRHSFTFDYIPSATDPTKTLFSVKHIPVSDGEWGEVTRLVEATLPLALSELNPKDFLYVAGSLAHRAAAEIQMLLDQEQSAERK